MHLGRHPMWSGWHGCPNVEVWHLLVGYPDVEELGASTVTLEYQHGEEDGGGGGGGGGGVCWLHNVQNPHIMVK